MFNDIPEVTDGLFSRCEKKKEERKTPSCASKERKKERSKSACGCAPKRSMKRSRSRSRKSKRALNAFIIFYLELFAKSSGRHVTQVAIEAGKKWCSMSEKEKEKYIQKAKAKKGSKHC